MRCNLTSSDRVNSRVFLCQDFVCFCENLQGRKSIFHLSTITMKNRRQIKRNEWNQKEVKQEQNDFLRAKSHLKSDACWPILQVMQLCKGLMS